MNFIEETPCADVIGRRRQLGSDAPVSRYTWLKPVDFISSPSLGLYVMYLLPHRAILSRRACRYGLFTFLVLWLLPFCLSKPPNHAADTYKHESVNFDSKNQDVDVLYKAISTDAPNIQSPAQDAEGTFRVADPPVEKTKEDSAPYLDRYHVIKVSFDRVQTPFIIGLWIFCASLAKIGFHMAPQLSKKFPESCLLIFVGVVIGVILVHVTDSVHLTDSAHVSPLTPDTFFFYMLPPIILDAGYFMPNRLFFDHLGTILLFAVIGTIFNTLTIGASLWAVGLTGLFSCETPLLDMFLFGSLISAVDPVAVLAVFEEIHVNEILYIVVFGESLLNDAVTVVLYHLFESYKLIGIKEVAYTDVVIGFANFFVVAIGGTVIGVLWGFATGFVTKFTNEVRVIEPIFIFVMAYLAYLNAEIFHMSGILSITFCGITMKNYVEANISHKSHTTIKYTMKMLSSSSETIIFMLLGVATVSNTHEWNTWFILLTIIFCSVYRVVGVIIFTAIANRFRLHQLDMVEKFVLSYGGLRGAVAFALALLIKEDAVPHKSMYITTTIAVVYFTVFFQGMTIKPLVKILNVKTAEKRKPTMNERIHERLMDHTMAAIEDILGQHGNYHIRDRFKRFDNKFIRPLLLRNHQGAEPKILETYSKLAMRDAMDYMRRNASTIGNISGTESMSAIFKNYTANNLNGSTSFSQLDSSTWNIDMQELEYNPSKKDLTDARIHHLLAEELVKPYRRVLLQHRRLSYSRHAVNDRDLSTQVNYKMHYNMRRMVADRKHHHSKRHSKKLHKEGKHNHVSFPEFQQNGTAKQFSHDYINDVLQEDNADSKVDKEDWDSPITFTAKSSPSTETDASGSFTNQKMPLMGTKNKKCTISEAVLPWKRERLTLLNVSGDIMNSSSGKRSSRGSIDGGDLMRVTTPTATETMLPWKRGEEENSAPLQQCEFPAWASNKEYLAYNSPSATFLGGIENHRSSVIGLFRRESIGSEHFNSSNDSTPRKERRESSGTYNTATMLVDDGNPDPLGVIQKTLSANTIPPLPQPPQTPGQRRQNRRGSMLELTGSITQVTIPEESSNRNGASRKPGWLQPNTSSRIKPTTCKPSFGTQLISTVSSPSQTESESDHSDADIECLMKAGL
ncbi:sodium/hydrogen exchanger 3 isoform X3 [Harmonia axyridis]|uniref:sodium/hydrogen exchanger 3 isoform X3 n=1 Tax=Harmonia axyridis TaxID=115357 RepID=UPI001E278CE1|nr:sodium/hydrogen exchanger 3 isoform X3 [Harmonia axyridis]